MFSKLDSNNDGDTTEAEFIKVCLADKSLYHNLETKKTFSGSPRKESVRRNCFPETKKALPATQKIIPPNDYPDWRGGNPEPGVDVESYLETFPRLRLGPPRYIPISFIESG